MGVEIERDAVLFKDGALYGKDTRREADNARLADNFLAYCNAKQTLYKHVLASVDKGYSAVDEIRKILHGICIVWVKKAIVPEKP